jgi:hypothetical protein
MGFNLVLDSWQLISPDVFAASQCRSYSCGRTSIRARTASVPVFNQDLSALRSGKNRWGCAGRCGRAVLRIYRRLGLLRAAPAAATHARTHAHAHAPPPGS